MFPKFFIVLGYRLEKIVGDILVGYLPSALSDNAARIVIELHNNQPLDLLEFTASLTAFAREHKAFLKGKRPGVQVEESRVLIVDIRKGSTVLELLPVLAPIIATAEVTNTVAEFVGHIRSAFDSLKSYGGRLSDPTTQQLKNMADSVRGIAADSDGRLKMAARFSNGDVIQEFVIDKNEARTVLKNAIAQKAEIEDKRDTVFKKVLMRLHQSSVEDLKVGKRTSEKGIVERISGSPLPLVYVSDDAGSKIKQEILKPEGNPFQRGFIVDLDVETMNDKPRVYRILEVHQILDLEE